MSGIDPVVPIGGNTRLGSIKDRERIEEEIRMEEEKVDVANLEDHGLKPDGLNERQMKSESDNYTIGQTLRIFWKPVLICSTAAFSAVTDGYQGKMNSNILANKGFVEQFRPAGAAKLDSTHVATWGGLASLGQVVGQALAKYPNDYMGRRGGMFVCMLLLLISVTVEYTSKQWWHYAIAKLIAGWGVGAVQATLPLFISEHAPPQVRGTVIVCYSLWYSIGGLLSSVTLQVNKEKTPLDWQTPILTQYGMVGLSTIIFILLPETPWWLVSKGKLDKARKTMIKINSRIPGYDADHEIGIMEATLEKQKEANVIAAQAGRWAVLKGLNMKRFLIASWPKVLQQFVGLAIFSNYSAYFFDLAGNKNPFMVTIILTCAQIVAVFFDAALVDRLGRRIMTIVGFGGACFGVLLIAIVGCFNYESPQLGALLVFGGTAANFFNSFQSSTSYAYLTELSEQRLRATTAALGLAYCNIYAVILNFIVPIMLKAWKVRASWFFVCTGIPGTVLAYFIMPESARRSSAEIQEMFVERVPLRKWKGHKTAVERDLEIRMGQVSA